MKRFYRNVSVGAAAGGFEILLDGRPIRLPGSGRLVLPFRTLAEAIGDEWAAQGDAVIPETMPLMQLAATALREGGDREADIAALCRYLPTDLLRYRAPQAAMAARQAQLWDEWLGWFHRRFGVRLGVTDGLAALSQPESADAAVADALRAMDPFRFTAAQVATSLTGSIVLGLAFAEGAGSPEELLRAARVEEDCKAEIYGEAIHGPAPHQERNDRSMLEELRAAGKLLSLIGS